MVKRSKSNMGTVEGTNEITAVEGAVIEATKEPKPRSGALGFRIMVSRTSEEGQAFEVVTPEVFATLPDANKWLKRNPLPHGLNIEIHRISVQFVTTAPERTVSSTIYRKV